MTVVAATIARPITLPDGRVLLVHEAGDPQGVPVVVHHGTPGAGILYGPWVDDAVARGIRLISYDRAGYAGSDRSPGRDVAAVAGDVASALDVLGVDEFLTWGVSGGGPHALACAGILPQRVRAVSTIGGIAPWDCHDLDHTDGMGADNVEEFGLAEEGEDVLRPWLDTQRDGVLAATPDGLAEQMHSLLPPIDVATLSGPAGPYLVQSMSSGLAPGVDGWLDDDLAFVRPWGFELAAITAPVLVRQGGLDLMVPLTHMHWLSRNLREATESLDANQGHLSLMLDVGRVHAWLLQHWHS